MSSPKTCFRFHKKRKGEYPKKCPFCRERKYIAKGWARFPHHRLTKRDKAAKPLFLALTDQAEQEWYDFIVCLNCYRIIWHQLDPHGLLSQSIPLPTLRKLTLWQKVPYTPVVLYDEEGNPIYGTTRSQHIYRQANPATSNLARAEKE